MKRKPKNPIHKIRTGTGDTGTTYLQTPGVSKSAPVVQFVGDLDEANASLGNVAIDRSSISCDTIDMLLQLKEMLAQSQTILFEIGAMVHSTDAREQYENNLSEYVTSVSAGIQKVIEMAVETSSLKPLEGFIVPNQSNAAEMLSRAVIRRAERSAINADCLWAVPALNTMSDLLFLIAWHNTAPMEQWSGFKD